MQKRACAEIETNRMTQKTLDQRVELINTLDQPVDTVKGNIA